MNFMKTLLAIACLMLPGVVTADTEWRYLGSGAMSTPLEQTVAMNDQSDAAVQTAAPTAPQGYPVNNMTMTAVRNQFGQPDLELPGVGEPPIFRWQYAGFTVYFENDRVLTTVIN